MSHTTWWWSPEGGGSRPTWDTLRGVCQMEDRCTKSPSSPIYSSLSYIYCMYTCGFWLKICVGDIALCTATTSLTGWKSNWEWLTSKTRLAQCSLGRGYRKRNRTKCPQAFSDPWSSAKAFFQAVWSFNPNLSDTLRVDMLLASFFVQIAREIFPENAIFGSNVIHEIKKY